MLIPLGRLSGVGVGEFVAVGAGVGVGVNRAGAAASGAAVCCSWAEEAATANNRKIDTASAKTTIAFFMRVNFLKVRDGTSNLKVTFQS
jgi:hypothetical protein